MRWETDRPRRTMSISSSIPARAATITKASSPSHCAADRPKNRWADIQEGKTSSIVVSTRATDGSEVWITVVLPFVDERGFRGPNNGPRAYPAATVDDPQPPALHLVVDSLFLG